MNITQVNLINFKQETKNHKLGTVDFEENNELISNDKSNIVDEVPQISNKTKLTT
jgi:hypothetical protein